MADDERCYDYLCYRLTKHGFLGVLIILGHFFEYFILDVNCDAIRIELYGIFFWQAFWQFLLDSKWALSKKGAVESTFRHIEFSLPVRSW